MTRLRPFLILAVFAAITLPLMPLQQLFVWTWPRMARVFPMHYHRLVLKILGVRLKIVGAPLADGPALLASNHVSWLDIPVLSAVAPISFIAKREVNGWPFFGSLARLQRTVFVDRNRRHATGNSRDEMHERFKAGDLLVLFPEGTSSDGIHVLPFKSAFFGAAEYPDVLVQPVTIAYTGHRGLPMTRRLLPFYAWYGGMELAPHLWAALAQGPIEVTVHCHQPLSLGGELTRKQLARHVETLVKGSLAAALHRRDEMG
ncbi:MAG: 1-acyl-sn-glycerol-3-phosphate acyltransferase [Rhizobiales bacterium]|nr:1-acyl-sn-glycerol-3-phosphate acyltransferase [Hyphomicrobiales bacterium]MBI3673260.1 1-acyl-sn-glycerol-3-phosphate acyltransferase [Hyphomicrobiales bacterium]